jgi:hypothetical protein
MLYTPEVLSPKSSFKVKGNWEFSSQGRPTALMTCLDSSPQMQLMMKAMRTSKMLINFYQTTQSYNPAHSRLHLKTCCLSYTLPNTPSWRTTLCQLSMTAHSIYLQLPFISSGCHLQPQLEDALCPSDKGPMLEKWNQYIKEILCNHRILGPVQVQILNFKNTKVRAAHNVFPSCT